MGQLVEGVWHKTDVVKVDSSGKFVRPKTTFHHKIGEGALQVEPNRYHLYVSYACPWAHRTLIFRALKGLQKFINVSVVDNFLGDEGWTLSEGADSLYGTRFLRDFYTKADPHYTGRVSVPILWDKKYETIVNNESAEIIRMFNSAFNELTGNHDDYYPSALQEEIDEVNDFVYSKINNGVYKAGFAKSQHAYDQAVEELFAALDILEARLNGKEYLVGGQLTEADWRFFTTLIRFDPVYSIHFKCSLKRIKDYKNLSALRQRLYEYPGISETVKFDAIKEHYYMSHKQLNPSGIIPCIQNF